MQNLTSTSGGDPANNSPECQQSCFSNAPNRFSFLAAVKERITTEVPSLNSFAGVHGTGALAILALARTGALPILESPVENELRRPFYFYPSSTTAKLIEDASFVRISEAEAVIGAKSYAATHGATHYLFQATGLDILNLKHRDAVDEILLGDFAEDSGTRATRQILGRRGIDQEKASKLWDESNNHLGFVLTLEPSIIELGLMAGDPGEGDVKILFEDHLPIDYIATITPCGNQAAELLRAL